MEGGANAIAEAVLAGVPVLASQVSGNIGMLGARYPGLFGAGQTRDLRGLLIRLERDPAFRKRLRRAGLRRVARFAPAAEARGWRRVLAELSRHRQNGPAAE